MTTRYATEGFVLNKDDYREDSRIFSVFTKDFGKIHLLGRGIRKIDSKLRSGMEVFSVSSIEFVQGRMRKTLTDAVFLQRLKHIFNTPHMLEVAHKISQVADSFVRGEEPDEKVWNLLVESFAKLNHYQLQPTHCQLVYCYFFWNFVSILGYQPQLANCASCAQKLNPYELYFSNKEGGVICKGCYNQKQEGFKIKSDVVKVLRLIVNKDWNMLSKLRIERGMQEALSEISDRYYAYLNSSLVSNFNLDHKES